MNQSTPSSQAASSTTSGTSPHITMDVPKTPQKERNLTPLRSINSPVIRQDFLLWNDGSRSPTLDTRKGQSNSQSAAWPKDLMSRRFGHHEEDIGGTSTKRQVRLPTVGPVAHQKMSHKYSNVKTSKTMQKAMASNNRSSGNRRASTDVSQASKPKSLKSTRESDNPAIHWTRLFSP